MGQLQITQIARKIRELFENHLDKSDLKKSDPDYDSKALTRCLAAYAIYHAAGCSEQEAANAVIDGSDDNGLDAVFYSAANRKLYVAQSKWIHSGSGEPSLGDVHKFVAGIRALFDLEFSKFNSKLNKNRALIESAIAEDFECRYEIILIYTGTQSLAVPAQSVLDDLIAAVDDTGEKVELSVMNQGKIYASIPSKAGAASIELEIGLTNFGKVEAPYTAYYGMVQGEEIGKWWAAHGDKLLARNLRFSLGRTDVNEEIRHTLENSPEQFWYFNNGITIVADAVKKSMAGGSSRDFGSFKAEGVSVVNGAQTVSTIGRAAKQGKFNLSSVYVPLRIISLEDAPEQFGELVTKTNNRQNRIEPRDFVSHDVEQVRLKTEIAHEGFDYNLVRSESFASSEMSFDVTEAVTALSCASGNPGLATQVKREIGKFWEDLSKAPYRAVFNATTSGVQVVRAVQILRLVDVAIKKRIAALDKRSGKLYGTLVHGNRMIALVAFYWLGRPLLEDPAKNFDPAALSSRIEKITDEAINRLYGYAQQKYGSNMLATVFKNAAYCRSLFDNCISPKPNF